MRILHKSKGLLAGVAWLGAALPVWSQTPSVNVLLDLKPTQKGIAYTTPSPQEVEKCTVESVRGPKGNPGWALKDPKGALLRKVLFGAQRPDQWSYYKDGMEVYRESDTNGNGRPDRFAWLNSNGMKVGIDKNEDGTLDGWQAMSVEELSQEVIKALAAKDYALLQTLLVTEEDLKELGAPAREITRIKDLQKQTESKFRQTASKLNHLNESTRWLHLETSSPSRLPADSTGMKHDVLMHYRGLILCETKGKPDHIQLGEIVLAAEAWKLIDAPTLGDAGAVTAVSNPSTVSPQDAEFQELLKKLADLDRAAPKYGGMGPDEAVARYHGQRAGLIEQIIAKAAEADRALWQRQQADSLSTAAQAGDLKGMERLAALAGLLAKDKPGSEAAGYAAFRELSTDYALKVAAAKTPEQMLEVQSKFVDRLAAFVSAYPQAEDAADALLQLGTISDIQNKEKEARKWYEQLVQQFGKAPQAAKAAGALRRLNLEGKPWELTAQVVSLTPAQFTMDVIRGKTVVIYYWATWCQTAAINDFAKLKELSQQHSKDGLVIVAINLDDAQADAEAFLRKHAPPGYHLYAGGGQESPLATYYGLIVFPNVFLVNRDGKVVSRSVEVPGLEIELKKMFR